MRLATFDMSLEEAALDLGSTPFEAFRLVTLPIIAPAVISGWLLAFTLSLDDLVIASFTSGPSATTLPIKIFSAVRLGVSPEINALSTIMIAIVTIGVISASLISNALVVRQRLEEQQACVPKCAMSMKLPLMVPIPFGTSIGQRQFHLFHCRH